MGINPHCQGNNCTTSSGDTTPFVLPNGKTVNLCPSCVYHEKKQARLAKDNHRNVRVIRHAYVPQTPLDL